MLIYAFAYKKRRGRRLRWFLTSPVESPVAAIRAVRGKDFQLFDMEPYAGPLVQRCYVTKCRKPASVFIGQGGWLAVCEECSHGPFPQHDRVSRC